MAWKARLRETIVSNGDQVVASFDYFDDAAPAVILHAETFSFSPNWSNADMQEAVQARGKSARDARQRASALAQTFPAVTTIINIP